jgi:hypothetical protein
MSLQISGKLIQLLPLQTGESKNGTWKKQDIIIETQAQYPKKVCISIWGDKINESILKVGNMLNISFDIESREYNGRWYTDIKAWKIESVGVGISSEPANDAPDYRFDSFPTSSEESNILPFSIALLCKAIGILWCQSFNIPFLAIPKRKPNSIV